MKNKHTLFRLALSAALLGLAAGAAKATDLSLSSWVDSVKVTGDFRLRFENLHYRQNGIDYDRERYRLRLGVELPMPDGFTFKSRFTNVNSQVSANQTMNGIVAQDSFGVDRAYVEWKAPAFVKVEGGRMAQPLWTQYTSDVLWDDNYNPQGLGENLESPVVGPVKFFANGLQMVDSSNKLTNRSQFTFSEQVGAEVRLPLESRLKIGFANHNWVNVSTIGVTPSNTGISGMAEGVNQDGNRELAGNTATNALLANHFRVDELTAQLSFWVMKLPVTAEGTYIRNVGAMEKYSPKYNTGFEHGIIIGKASAKNTFEAAYFVKNVGADATVAATTDADFGDNGGTNRKGRIYWVAYNPQDFLQFKVKFYTTATRDTNAGGYATAIPKTSNGATNVGGTGQEKDVNRFQLDMSIKF